MTDNVTEFPLTGSPETFDLLGAIEGTTFPEIETAFYFDAEAANLIHNLNKQVSLAGTLGRVEEYEALEPVLFQAIEALNDQKYTVTVRGVPRKVQKAWIAKAQAKHPQKQAKGGVPDPNLEALAYFELLQWQSQIVKITDPQGRVNTGPFPEETIQSLLDNAPQASLEAVADAIQELETGAKAGYEAAVRNVDFSRGRSPEEPPGDSQAPSE